MAIPKIIYQTFKTAHLPLINRLAVKYLKMRNPEYRYEFFDDERILQFLRDAYPPEVLKAYQRLAIGAAKADLFRYAVLYKTGGVYLDIDAYVPGKLSNIIRPDDVAVIARENTPDIFVQWALIYAPAHKFLEKTIERVLRNISTNAYPHSVHGMTGPTSYSLSIFECLKEDPAISYREDAVDYGKKIRPRLPFSRRLYKGELHWKVQEKTAPVLHIDQKPDPGFL